MALETERTPAVGGFWEGVRPGVQRVAAALGSPSHIVGLIWRRLVALRPIRFISASLVRRILVTNLIGLSIIIGGILYFSQYHAWLIDAKRESLKVQGEMIAAAIASDARVETGRLVVNTDKLPGVEASRVPSRDDGFAALELSIRPERVTPILRRLLQPTKTRARVYSRDGTLIVDSATLLTRGQIFRHEPSVTDDKKPKLKNFWTRLRAWLIDKDLPVYKEIGNGNGTAYPEVRMALTGTTTPMLLLNQKGEQIVSMAVPIRRISSIEGVLLLSTRPGEIDKILAEEQGQIWILGSIALLATIVTSFLLARTVAGPMRRLSEAAEHVSRDITARKVLPEYAERTDEVGQMAAAFSSMTAALYRRIEASESFAADVAHELKNPLTAARSTAEALAYAKTDAQHRELVTQLQYELKRLNRLITDVSNVSRLDAELARQQMNPFNVTEVMAGVAQMFRDNLVCDTRRVVTILEPGPFDGAFTVVGDAGRIGQVLINLVDNAISFSPEDRTVTLRARHVDSAVELAVDDEGPGIPEDRLKVIFDRFYTDRPHTEATQGKNSGLGLSISREIVRSHGGEIWAENRKSAAGAPARGARLVVRLPALLPATRAGATGGRRV
ncbi:MAG TPA: stimulus-sensing domain-containing protein [Hyphomicrobiaceae bacterium]|nr:stimulus-sensing domain-containing protein [Hyphomicrobiaceae bacterium]